jgi:branched-chain amino acid transport system ATP-binding protein
MLAVNALDVDINGTPILRGIGLEINSGEIIGLIGRNGAGKTTFLRSVMGLLPIVDGSIYHNDKDLKKNLVIAERIWVLGICQKIGGLFLR